MNDEPEDLPIRGDLSKRFAVDTAGMDCSKSPYPGRDRHHLVTDTNALAWEPEAPGVEIKPLYSQPGFSDSMRLERWAAGADPGPACYAEGVEFFVLEGTLEDELGAYPKGTWLRLPVGASHRARSRTGCRLYAKRGGFPYLRAG